MIRAEKLNKTYDRHSRHSNRVLKDVSFTLPDRGFVCILGPSGCGKTSLLNVIGGLDRFDNGTLSTDNVDVHGYGTRAYERERNINFGYIFQNYYMLDEHSAAYNVYLGLHSLKLTHAEKLRRVRQALEAVDMERYINRNVGELSGGQQQRVAIARALARRPRVIFADEPTGNLDEANTINICTLLRRAAKNSLVIMVTHEERIARFFADRIITLRDGELISDNNDWQRDPLSTEVNQTVYTDGLAEMDFSSDEDKGEDSVTLRMMRDPEAPPVDLTVAVLADRIVIKVDDTRRVQLGTSEDEPKIVSGSVPELTLEEIDRQESDSQDALFNSTPAEYASPGNGITLPMMMREARSLGRGHGMKRIGMRLFLILLTALTLWMTGDFIFISSIDPTEFILTDSRTLNITIEQGPNIDLAVVEGEDESAIYNRTAADIRADYIERLENSGLDIDFLPSVASSLTVEAALFSQLESVTLRAPAFSNISIDRFDESTLIYGRMPENYTEIVVDKLVLQAILKTNTLFANSITDTRLFLGKTVSYGVRDLHLTIVGISDSGERSVFMSKTTMACVSAGGGNVLSFSELKALYPGEYDDMDFSVDEYGYYPCAINLPAAGYIWKRSIPSEESPNLHVIYRLGTNSFFAKYGVELPELKALIIVSDESVDSMIKNGYTAGKFSIYCEDKEAVREYLSKTTEDEKAGYIIVKVSDPYEENMNEYREAARLRADARLIVTVTVIALCIVMLYLLCRTQAQGRIKLLAVYRLLGIPKRKLHLIFSFEAILSALTTVLPAAVIIGGGIPLLNMSNDIELAITLPWYVTVAVAVIITIYFIFVSILPLFRLLSSPPAGLAAKYDI